MRLLAELAQSGISLGDRSLVALLIAELGKRDRVVALALDPLEARKRSLDLLALAHQALRAALIVPEIRCFRLAVERYQPRARLVRVKDAS
jgi:hypothetical protein